MRRLVPIALPIFLACAASAAAATRVTLRVEGADHTLLGKTKVTLPTKPVVKDGDAAHACAGTTVAGALETGLKGDWSGTWADQLGYGIDQIGGEFATFNLWVGNKLQTTSVCQTPLRTDDSVLLFANERGTTMTPLTMRAPKSALRKHAFTITVLDYSTKGRATPEAKATVYANGQRVGRTDGKGRLKVRGTKPGLVEFYAAKSGKARTATAVTRIRKR